MTGTTQPTCQWDDNYGWVCSDPSTVWTHVGGENFAYDLDGNLTNKYNGSFSQALSWNSLGQLASVTTNGSTIGYGYDGFGRRVRTTYPDGRVVRHVYDGDHLLMELDAGGNVQAKYTYYPGVDRPHAMIRGGVTYYYGSDQQGSVLALFNGGSQVVNRYSYLPFGEAETVTEGVANPLRYAGREYEAATGLYYNRNRWYDPVLHRFISEDPIGAAGGPNLYAYVANDPVNHVDPSGLAMRASGSTDCLWAGGYLWCTTVYVLETIKVVGERFTWSPDLGRFTPRGPNFIDPAPGSSCFVHGCNLRPATDAERRRVERVLNNLDHSIPFCQLVTNHGLDAANRDLRFFNNPVFTHPRGHPSRLQIFGNAPFDTRLGGTVMYLYGRPGKLYDSDFVHEAVHTVPRFTDPFQGYPDGTNPYYFTPLGSIDQTARTCMGG